MRHDGTVVRWEAGVTAETVLWAMWSATGLARAWQETALGGGPGAQRADRDLDAVVGLFDAAAKFADRLPQAGPEEFLTHPEPGHPGGHPRRALPGRGDGHAPHAPGGGGPQWRFVVVAGVQEGVWPDLRLRGSLLGSEQLVDVLTGRAGSFRGAQAAVRYDETRLFLVALTRARARVLVTAVRSDDEQPSVYLDVVDPLADASDGIRPFTEVRRAMTLPTLVAQLRREAVADDGSARAQAVDALGLLAREGVAAPTRRAGGPCGRSATTGRCDRRASSSGCRRPRSSHSASAGCGGCSAPVAGTAPRWERPTSAPSCTTSRLRSGTPTSTLRAEVDARWGRLGMPSGWVSDRKRLEAHAMVGWLARYFDRAARDGWQRIGAELAMEVTLGRAVISGRVDRLERLPDGSLRVIDYKTGSASSKPRDDELPTHPQLGAYQLAITGGAFAEHGTRSGARHCCRSARPPARPTSRSRRSSRWRRTTTRAGPSGWWPTPRRAWRRPFHGDRRPLVRRVCGQGQLPGPARGEDAVTTHAQGKPPDVRRRVRPSSGAASSGTATLGYSADDIASALEMHTPTDEQRAVIEAPLSPLLVVAGAGSGKTETMASRVVWLVANGLVEPDQVLGLTFTRKAATELAERITQRLRRLQRTGLWTPRAEDEAEDAETWAAPRRCRPTTRTPGGWCASMRCGSGTSPSPGCCPRPRHGSTPPRSSCPTTAPWTP